MNSETRKYYESELTYLRELGREFAAKNPGIAAFLGEGASDPDVERLLQGFAFLASRIHERLDNQYSEIAEAFLSVVWPQSLLPIPSLTMVQFDPDLQGVRQTQSIPAGASLQTRRYHWGEHRFRTCRHVDIHPFRLANASIGGGRDSSTLILSFELGTGINLREIEFGRLAIYVSRDITDETFVNTWMQWLTQYVTTVVVRSDNGSEIGGLGISYAAADTASLIPASELELPGHRLMREYLAYPNAFHFVEITGVERLKELNTARKFDIILDFGRHSPNGAMRKIDPRSFRIHCVPAVNLFPATSRISLDFSRSEYLVRALEFAFEHHEVFTLSDVSGLEVGADGREIVYLPLRDFGTLRRSVSETTALYRTRRVSHPRKPGTDLMISFQSPGRNRQGLKPQSISIDMLCNFRGGTDRGEYKLEAGDLCEPTLDVPAHVRYVNIADAAPQIRAVDRPDYLWRLVSACTLSRKTMSHVDDLKDVLYCLWGGSDQESNYQKSIIENLSGLEFEPAVSTASGYPTRVIKTRIKFDCGSEHVPMQYMFGIILAEFLRSAVTVNSRLEPVLEFTKERLEFPWVGRRGRCAII